MTKTTKTVLATLAAIALTPAVAFAAPVVGETVGTTLEEITSNLQSAGYEVREIEQDDDEFEVEIMVDGQLYELEIALDTGMITEVELEDEDDDDDDDDDDMSESAN